MHQKYIKIPVAIYCDMMCNIRKKLVKMRHGAEKWIAVSLPPKQSFWVVTSRHNSILLNVKWIFSSLWPLKWFCSLNLLATSSEWRSSLTDSLLWQQAQTECDSSERLIQNLPRTYFPLGVWLSSYLIVQICIYSSSFVSFHWLCMHSCRP